MGECRVLKINETGIENINKAAIKIYTRNKQEVAKIQNVEYCDIYSQQLCNGKMGLVLSSVELDKVIDLSYSSTIEKIAEQPIKE